MDNKCICCNVDTDQHKLIRCCICKNSYKYSCAGLTLNDIKNILTKPGLSYTCVNCTAIRKDINELKAIILQLKNEVPDLKAQKSVAVESSHINSSVFNDVVQDIMERQRRPKNLIVYGVEENESSIKDTRFAHDVSCVNNVLNFLSDFTNQCNIKPVRLGKYLQNRNRPRPIKIILHDGQTVHEIVRKSNLLKNSNFNNVRISLDHTPKQREYYNNLKMELSNRLANGERDLKIKYVNGVPVIKSLN